MCGLVGVVGDINGNDEKVFKHLLVLDTIRGEHSTGVGFIPKNGDANVVKQVGNPFELFNDKRFEDGLRKKNKVLIGHNRYATQGEVNKKNAHPFHFDHIIGAHNGTLSSRYKLQDNKDFAVDSMALYNHISIHGIEDAIEKIAGAWALTWWDDVEQEFCMLRNDERPLFITYALFDRAMFWASEAWMLDIALAKGDIKHGEVAQIKSNTLIRIPVNNKGEMGEGVTSKLEAPKVITTQLVMNGGGVGGNTTSRFPQTTNSTTTKETKQETSSGNVLALPSKPNVVQLPDYCSDYLGVKGQLVEIIARGVDTYRAHYVLCQDPMDPTVKIRLYLPANHMFFVGEFLEGDIQGWNAAEGGYLRMDPSSIKKVVIPDEAMVKDHKGNSISVAEFRKRYPACAWCTVDLDPENLENVFSRGGDCVCPDCAKDSNIADYLK